MPASTFSRPLLRSMWRDCAPTRAFQFYLAVHLTVSFGYMYFFCRHFGFSRRLAVLHLSALAGPTVVLVLVNGLLVVLTRERGRRLARYLIAGIYAAWSTALALLYVAHFVGNSLWGNNVNYQIVSHFLLRRRVVDDGLALSPSINLILVAVIIAIVAVHAALSGRLLRALEHLFSSERWWNVFRGSRPVLKCCLVLGLVVVAYGAYVHALPAYLSSDWSVELEPITSFFQLDLYDTRPSALAARLRIEEPRARASYSSGHTFTRKNVIVIIVDSLRADHMQVYGYGRPTTPFLTRLAQASKLRQVRFATATCAESNCGILSTLSSKTLPAVIPEDFKLHDLLHDQGTELISSCQEITSGSD